MENKEEIIKIIDNNTNEIHLLIQKKIDIWLEYVLFSPLWWFGVILSVSPWILWIFFRKKNSTDRLLYSGLFVMVIALMLDLLGDQLGLWHYRFNVIPVLPTYFPWDISLMPVTVMFLIQIKPNFNPLIKAIIFSLITSFVGEPIFNWMKLYQPLNWEYAFSVPIQVVIYLIAHYITKRNHHSTLHKL